MGMFLGDKNFVRLSKAWTRLNNSGVKAGFSSEYVRATVSSLVGNLCTFFYKKDNILNVYFIGKDGNTKELYKLYFDLDYVEKLCDESEIVAIIEQLEMHNDFWLNCQNGYIQ